MIGVQIPGGVPEAGVAKCSMQGIANPQMRVRFSSPTHYSRIVQRLVHWADNLGMAGSSPPLTTKLMPDDL